MTIPVRILFVISLLVPAWAQADSLKLSPDERPPWIARDGIVMAGSWEPLGFRVRRDGSPGYEPTARQRADYEREHSPEMVQKLKQQGVNFVMMHCYKGGGLKAERESMDDAVRFARLCHDAGLRVGVYNFSGALVWELFFQERPDARNWDLRTRDGKPVTYGQAVYRHYWDRNHPDAEAFYRTLVRFAVEDIQADLIHFDNYHVGPGYDANSVARFRRYLAATFTSDQLDAAGITELANTLPPEGPGKGLLRYGWEDFQCQSLADSYWAMCRYARTLRRDVLVECNPAGVLSRIHAPVDHGRLLQGGEAFWDEGDPPGLRDGKLATRILTYKVARRMDNMAFAYTRNPLEMAEAMAFNLDCLGCICWFEYARMTNYPGERGKPIVPETAPFVRFFHQRRDLMCQASIVADIAVLRSFASQMFAPPEHAALTNRIERGLIENRGTFQVIYDHQLADLERYRTLVLAGCVAMSDEQIQQVQRYVRSGGRMAVVGPVATHDQWMNPRKSPGLGDLPDDKVVQIPAGTDTLGAIEKICGARPSLAVTAKGGTRAPLGLCAELTEQPHRRLLHLVNYRENAATGELEATVRIPVGRQATEVRLASPEHGEDLKVAFHQEGELVRFTIPTVRVYEIAVVTWADDARKAQPALQLKSRTLLKEGEVSPQENAVYSRPTGVEMLKPSARSEDNGRTWTSLRPQPDFDSKLRKGFRRGAYPPFVDPVEDRLITLVLSLDVPDLDPGIEEPPIGENEYYLRYRVSTDGGKTYLFDERIHQAGDYTDRHPLDDVWLGKNGYYLGDVGCIPIRTREGKILVPIQVPLLGPDGKLALPGGGFTHQYTRMLIGTWTEGSRLRWDVSEKIVGDPDRTSRGLFEPTLAELPDGRILCVMRGSNGGRRDTDSRWPAYKWMSVSRDGGRTWSAPQPWKYSDGGQFHSPSSMSQLLRYHDGRVFWIGNLSDKNCSANNPRYPLVIGQVDPASLGLVRQTVLVIDSRRPEDTEGLNLSHWLAYEDRPTGDLVIGMRRWTGDYKKFRGVKYTIGVAKP